MDCANSITSRHCSGVAAANSGTTVATFSQILPPRCIASRDNCDFNIIFAAISDSGTCRPLKTPGMRSSRPLDSCKICEYRAPRMEYS